MLSANSCLLLNTKVLGITNVLRDHQLPPYPPRLCYITKDKSAINSRICIYHTNQFNTRLYCTVNHANIIDSCQYEPALSGNDVIDTSEVIDSQRFGLVVQSIATPNNRNYIHILLDNGEVSDKRFPIYFISFLDFINIISISFLF